MARALPRGRRTSRFGRRLRARAVATAIALVLGAGVSLAQITPFEDPPEGEQLLLNADTLVYNYDEGTVSAVGAVQMEYGGIHVVAQRVTYDINSSRVVASGNVELVDEDGNRYYTDSIDITEDFSEGFVEALRVETADETYIAAESAERRQGRFTTFTRGVYTACEPCEERPDRPPLWQIKARKVIWDSQEKTIRFERPRIEFFGFPLAFLPFLEVPDPTVERKSGFLAPSIVGGSELGYGLKVPYYLALSDTYDLTVSATGYSNQGLVAEAEWRQRFNNGSYQVRIAGISQLAPEEWNSDEVDSTVTERGMIGTNGHFEINPRWAFGWDVLVQSDKNFSRTYGIEGFSDSVYRSQAYLTGLNDRNYFDLRTYHFQVQESAIDPNGRNNKQPFVLPILDYSFTPDTPMAGGELNFDINAQSLRRDEAMFDEEMFDEEMSDGKLQGLEGGSGRLTAEAEWKRSFVTDNGIVLTPILHARGDAIYADYDSGALDTFASNNDFAVDVRSAYYRSMATAGLEARWPILFTGRGSSHVLEPMAQIFVRPDEPYHGELGIPNEDAQSLVFDATTLFERDKFSGYDRIEGGTRANVGIRYSGSFGRGWTAHGLFGQSYHLGGVNSFASPDLVYAGAYSGLETDVSDFVGLVGLTAPNGTSVSAAGRFDEETFDLRRTSVSAATRLGPVRLSGQYVFIEAQPDYGFDEDRKEVTASTSIRFNENWRGFASGTYDLEEKSLVRNSFGFAYDDECFTYVMSFSERRKDNDETERRFGINVSLRTLGDFGGGSGDFTQ